MLTHGYHCEECKEQLFVLEKEDFSESEWDAYRKLFGFESEPNVTIIHATISKIECWNDLKGE